MDRSTIDRISTGVARATSRRRFAAGTAAALIATVPAVGLVRGVGAAEKDGADGPNERKRKCERRCERRCEDRQNPSKCRRDCKERRCDRDD